MILFIWINDRNQPVLSQQLSQKRNKSTWEHIARDSYDSNESNCKGHLAVVDSMNDSNVLVFYMEKSDKEVVQWLCPDHAEIRSTNINQGNSAPHTGLLIHD